MSKFAIIGGGVMASYFGMACHRLGLESHYFSMIDGKVEDGSVDFFHEINIFDKEKITEICRELDVVGVVATTELSVAIAAYVAEQLGLLGLSYDVAQVITNKYRNRECIKGLSDLHSPKYVEATSLNDIKNSDVSYPMILKPINLGGKRGITVVREAMALPQAFDYAVNSFRKGSSPKIIAEQFLDEGLECSVESISYKGEHTIIQITQKDSSGAPHCVELGHHQPAPLQKEVWDKVVQGVSSGLTAIGLNNGPCHTEIKVVGSEVYLIEFNARPGGDHIWWPLVELSTGYDIFAGVVKAAMGQFDIAETKMLRHDYSGIYFITKQTNYLKEVFDKCETYPWCWKKYNPTKELVELTQNGEEKNNYFIYHSETGNPIPVLVK